MTTIYFRIASTIVPPFPVSPLDALFGFEVPPDAVLASRVALQGPIRLVIANGGATVRTQCAVAVPTSMRSRLAMGEHVSNLVADQIAIWASCLALLETAARQTIDLLTEELGTHGSVVSTASPNSYEWSDDDANWKRLPVQHAPLALALTIVTNLNIGNHDALRSSVAAGNKPLTSSTFITLARQSTAPQVKWILAAVAAEIGIKEGLVKLDPALETELTARRTPRVEKLFGPYLERITGAASPLARAIQEGADIRNSLVHSAHATMVDGLRAERFLNTVEEALHSIRRHIRPAVVPAALRTITSIQNAIPAPVTPEEPGQL